MDVHLNFRNICTICRFSPITTISAYVYSVAQTKRPVIDKKLNLTNEIIYFLQKRTTLIIIS